MTIQEQKPEHSSLRTLREVCNYLIRFYGAHKFNPPTTVSLPVDFTPFGKILMEKNITGSTSEQELFLQALQSDPSYDVKKYAISNPISTIRFVFGEYKFFISIPHAGRQSQFDEVETTVTIEGRDAENISYSDII